jgi:polyisoprenoid-binding protein YceI
MISPRPRTSALCAGLLPCILLVSAAARAQSQTFTIDPASSKVTFTLPDVLHTVHGSFALERGQVQFVPASGVMSGEIVVSARSGESGNKLRDERMTKDELNAQTYPAVTFAPKHLQGQFLTTGDSTVQVDGTFTLVGKQHSLQLPMHIHVADRQCVVTGTFQLPYVDWGLKNPSTFVLKVAREVQITLELKGSLNGH